jgi:hypothetical protein
MAHGFSLASDGWGRCMSFTTEKKDLTSSKDLLMNPKMEMLLHSDPALREETENLCV